MKKLLLTTALFGAAAMPALAQDQEIFRPAPDALEIRASDFMGMRVFATEAAVEGEETEGLQEGWEDIGEIDDLILDREGTVQAVLVDIGGFLGIGERRVALSMDAIQFLSDSATAEEAGDFFLVVNATREVLEQAPEYVVAETEVTAEQAAEETDEVIEEGAADVAAAGAAAGAAVEGAAEETGEEVAGAGAEVADEAADAGEEVAEEAAQADMTDVQEDQAEVADTQADAVEETGEETAQATDEAADEAADQTEMTAEGAATETEMEADQTAEAATEEPATDETAATDELAATDEATAEEPATEEMAATDEATAEMTEDEVAAAEQTSAETPARTPITREGFVAAGAEDFTAERLQGAAVYDANDERIGEVGEILLSEDGQVSDLVIDVGGFLGIGEKPVALPMDSVDILRQDGGEELRVYVSQAEEDLEAMERYEAQ